MAHVKQLFDLSGRVALVTGGSRGLGLQMAEALGEMGARVALTARKKDELDEAVAHLRRGHRGHGLGLRPRQARADRPGWSTRCWRSSATSTSW